MKLERFLGAALLSVAAHAFALPAAAPEAKSPLPWIRDDYGAALAQARARGVPIFVENWAPW
jgi:hypothetical protein